MGTFRVHWKNNDQEAYHGYCKARSEAEALQIFDDILSRGHSIIGVTEVIEAAITAKEMCVNFINPRCYEEPLAG